MSTVDPILVIQEAERADQAARQAKEALRLLLQQSLRARMRPGDVVDLRVRRGLPPHLWIVKTMRGSDRGSKVFRIESEPIVEFDVPFIELARWRCNATPISEKTGKEMSGRSHGANSASAGGLVAIHGEVFNAAAFDLIEESLPTAEARHAAVMAHVAAFIRSSGDTPATAPDPAEIAPASTRRLGVR